MNLLELCHSVVAELGLLKPISIIGNEDPTAERLLAAAQAAGQDLYRAHDWTILHREHEFTTEANSDNYQVPEDFGRLITNTVWDRHNFWQMRGALSSQEWQRKRSAMLASPGARRSYRLLVGPRAGSLLLDQPAGSSGETLVYEYVSRDWCENEAGAGQPRWEADTDFSRLDEELIRLGMVWRARKLFGHAYADDKQDYAKTLRQAKMDDLALPAFSLAGARVPLLVNIPDGSWGQ